MGLPAGAQGREGPAAQAQPINNARTDKLAGPFWSDSFHARRCLIPVSEFAEAEGPIGSKTRTWLSLPGQDLFAVAGFWRDTAEWGAAFTMVMTDACPFVRGLHDRMPVIVPYEHWRQYLGFDVQAAFDLCRPYNGDMAVRRTDEPWARGR